jgi:hypothetical protein
MAIKSSNTVKNDFFNFYENSEALPDEMANITM